MRLPIEVLLHVTEGPLGWKAECWSVPIATVAHSDREEAIGAVTGQVTHFLENEGKDWLRKWQQSGLVVNCPEGKIRLPSDTWECKITGDTCPIQAQVFLNNSAAFLEGCQAPSERANQVLSAQNIEPDSIRAELLMANKPLSILSSRICPSCAVEMIQLLAPQLASNFEICELSMVSPEN